MRKFVVKTLLGGGIIVLVVFLIETSLFFLPNAFTAKSNYLDEHLDDIKILMLGHSHAENGFIPSEIGDSVFNFSSGGRHIKYDVKIVEKYVPKMKNLKVVLYPIAYNFQYLSYDHICLKNNREWLNLYSLIPTFHCMYFKYYGFSYNKKSFLYWSEVINSKLDFWKRFLGSESDMPSKVECFKGYFPLPEKEVGWEKSQLTFEIDDNSPEKDSAYKENLDCLNQIAKICKIHNVKLLLISFPVYKTFLERVNSKCINEMKEYVYIIKNRHANIEYYNYIDDMRFSEVDFYNASHLTDIGAHKFSQILKKEVLDN